MNCRYITCRSVIASDDMHTLTSELQEVMVGIIAPIGGLVLDNDEALLIAIPSTAIPHSGQLNITNSTLSTPDLPAKSEMISIPDGLRNCTASS